MSPLALLDRGAVTAVFDRRHHAHLRFRLWGEQFEHHIGTDSRMLWGMTGDASTNDYENVVTSVLSDPDSTAAPVSPAFQEMRQRRRGDCCEFMAMGQFGPHRYSGVVAARSLASGMELDFDLADRRPNIDESFVCTYFVNHLAELDHKESTPSRLSWSLTPRLSQARLMLEAEPPARLEISRSNADDGAVVRVVAGSTAGADQRCRYRWHWYTPPLDESSSTPTST